MRQIRDYGFEGVDPTPSLVLYHRSVLFVLVLLLVQKRLLVSFWYRGTEEGIRKKKEENGVSKEQTFCSFHSCARFQRDYIFVFSLISFWTGVGYWVNVSLIDKY